MTSTSIANAQGREIPQGWWTITKDELTTCLEVRPGHQLRLTFKGKMDREPVVVDTEYVLTANKMADYHVTATVKKVWQKQLGSCRKAWIDQDLGETKQLRRTIKVGDALKLTLHHGCVNDHPYVQLCLHDDQVTCLDLADPKKTCTAGPAIDGSKINPPVMPPPPT